MRKVLFAVLLVSFSLAAPVKNPGIPAKETMIFKDYINKKIGFVTANVSLRLSADKKTYSIVSLEGGYFRNYITINAETLNTIDEKRYDGQGLLEAFSQTKNAIKFFYRVKAIDLKATLDEPVYSRYAFFVSLRGFPFEKAQNVTFKTYMFEYGDYLQMDVQYRGKETVKVKAGNIPCYKLEICVGGWQKVFAPDKYYLYYAVAQPHYFVKFDQKVEDGVWLSNELISYSAK